MSINVIDTLHALGNFPLANSNEIQCGSERLNTVLSKTSEELESKVSKSYAETNFAKKTDIPVKVSAFQNDKGYLTEHQDLSGKADVSTVETLTTRVSNTESECETLSSRMDTYESLPEGSTVSDARLEDICVMVDGTTSDSPGNAVRSQINDVKSELIQAHTDVADKYVRYANGVIENYPNNDLIVTTFPVAEGLNLIYSYTRETPDARGLAFFDASGEYISGVQAKSTIQEIEIPKRAVSVKATVTNTNQVKFRNIIKSISETIKTSNIASMVTVSKTGILTNADNALPNKIYTIYTSSYTSNLPTSDNTGGILFTLYNGSSSAGKAQIYISSNNIMYTRISWANGYGDWIKTGKSDMIEMGGIVTSESLPDCNDAEYNAIYTINDTSIANLPVNKKGVLICNSGSPNSKSNVTGGRVQIYITADGSTVFYRCTIFAAVVSWTAWNSFGSECNTAIATNMTSTPLEHIRNDAGLLSCFLKVGCIGDSLSSGECVYKDSSGNAHGVDIYEHSWGQYLARMTGNTYYNFSVGGLSAKTFHTTDNAKVRQFDDADKVCDMYFIGLGQNDKNAGNTIGTTSDININDYTKNADTYYGNYAKIIQRIKSKQPKAKIFIFTDPHEGVENAGYNTAVRAMPGIFTNVYLLDMYTYGNGMYRGSSSFIYNQNRVGHYNAISYKAMANITATYVDWIMKSRPSEFEQVEFIGTNYSF